MVGNSVTAGTEVAAALLATKSVLLHVPCLAFCEWLSVRGVSGEIANYAISRLHSLENIAAAGIRAADEVGVGSEQLVKQPL